MRPPRIPQGSRFFAAALVLAVLASSPLFAGLTIAKGGQARAQIVLASDAPAVERHAAEELALFLHIVTGADFPIASAPVPGRASIFVGPGAGRAADAGFPAGLGNEETYLASKAGNLFLAGGGSRGTLYAVYSFLEDAVGCRWWTRTASTMPHRPTLEVGDLNRRFKPVLEYREPFWYESFDPVWAARNRANGIQAGGGEIQGGRQVYEGFVHTFYVLIPPEVYFKDHPEWFSEINGQRTFKDAQLCLSNEEMRRELVKNLRERLRANPQATIASVSQNDCFGFCTCPKCRAVDAEEGGPAGSILRFVNAVAADLEAEFPNVAFDTLAYQYGRKPPLKVRPRPSVIVRLCSIEAGFAKPLDDPRNKAFFDDLVGWSKIAGRLYIWDYTTNFSHYIQPHPNYSVLAPNIRLFTNHSVRGIFEQGAYQSWASEMAEMRSWMLAQLLWNPNLDQARLRADFLRGYYGPAAGAVDRYLNLLEKAVADAGDPLGCYSPADAKFLTLGVLREGWRLLETAERKAGLDEYKRRVRIARLPAAYVVLTRWDALRKDAQAKGEEWPWGESREALLDWFVRSAKAENVAMISEGQTFEDWCSKGGKRR